MKPQASWLGAGCLAASLIGGALAGAVASRPSVAAQTAGRRENVVRAERFVLVDATGKALATLGVDETLGVRGAVLLIGDQAGTNRIVLGMLGDRPLLQFRDVRGRARLAAGADGTTALVTFFDPSDGEARMMLGTSADGTPQLSLHDAEARARASLYLTPDQHPVLKMADERDVTRASLGFSSLQTLSTGETERSPSSLVLFDRDGKVILKLP